MEVMGKKQFVCFPKGFQNLKIHHPHAKTQAFSATKGKKYGDLSLEEVIETDDKVDLVLKRSFYKLRHNTSMIHSKTF